MKRIVSLFSMSLFVVAACGGTTETTVTVPKIDPAEYWTSLVSERYADCFADLGVQGDATYEVNPSGTTRDGLVLITAAGKTLTFGVGTATGGAKMTVPFNEETINALESVDC